MQTVRVSTHIYISRFPAANPVRLFPVQTRLLTPHVRQLSTVTSHTYNEENPQTNIRPYVEQGRVAPEESAVGCPRSTDG